MFLPFTIFGQSVNKKNRPVRRPRVGLIECLEDRITPAIVDVGDSIATAQVNTLLPLVGGIRYEGQIGDGPFGNRDVDLFKFDVLQGATLRIETSLLSPNLTYDTYLRLFNSAGTQIAFDDDSGVDNFSLINTGSLSAGTYYVGVSGFPNSSYNPAIANSGTGANNFGFYTLNITDTSFGFTINGIDPGDGSGASVSSAGDINGDGFDDLIIGAATADPNGQNAAGESYVIFGKPSGFGASLNLSTLNGANGFVINGIGAEDISGRSVSSAGDINGDGFDDLLIGAPDRDRSLGAGFYANNAGESYVVFGRGTPFTASLDLSALNGANGFVIRGTRVEDYLGTSVSAAGDINGDGFDDLLIGADGRDFVYSYPTVNQTGASYVVYGKGTPFGAVLEPSSFSFDGTDGFFFNGIDAYDQLGYSVSAAGDINGDGFDDLIIGAPNADPNNQSEAGESYVVFGKGTPISNRLNLRSLDGTNGFVINGIDGGDQSGFSVSSAGDINGDGFDDLIIGATYADPDGRSNAGESYVVFGKASGFTASLNLSTINGTNGFVINGIDADDQSGLSVSAAGDVNGDGFDDLIISAAGGDPNSRVDAGESYVVFGKASGFGTSLNLSSLNGTNGFVVNGIDGGDRSGVSVSAAGDINGDGFEDLIIGAFYADPSGRDRAGESYVIFGRNFTNAVIELGTALANSLGGNANANTIVAGGGNDTIFGNGGADVIYAGQGNDQVTVADLSFRRVDGGSGVNRLNLSGSNQTLNLTTLADNRLINFSQIDLTGVGNNTLVIAPLDLLNMQAQADTLIVTGNAGDVVRLEGPLWSRQADEVVLGQLSFVYRVGRAVIKIPQVITVQTPAIINLSSLNGTTGFVINGIDELDRSGSSVSSAGDINGDGFDDLIIGAYYSYSNSVGAGESYVVFGKAGGFTAGLNLSSLNGTNGFVINGIETNDQSGRSVSSAGDINGDGFDDLIIGAPNGDASGTDAGESYVIFGKASGFGSSLDLSSLNGTNGFVINGIDEGDLSGVSVSSAGDINGDGFDDLIIGAPFAYTSFLSPPGASYIVFGKASGFTASLNLSSLDGTNGFALNGIGNNLFPNYTGFSVSSAGDINGDGFDDLIIGAPNENAFDGRSYVVYGKGTPFAASLNLFSLNDTLGFVIEGIRSYGSLGSSVSSAGDINGDGFDDLIIGVPGRDPDSQSDTGESYVVFGKASPFNFFLSPSSLDGTNGFALTGIDGSDQSGFSVSSAGDVNGDGFDDLIIGAPYGDPSGTDAGESYVVFGKASGFTASLNLSSLNSTDGFVLNGIDGSDSSGSSVSSAGDINGDGFDDLIIGASLADPSGRDRAGESYVVFGRNFTNAGIQQGSAVGETINGTAGANTIVAGQGNDTITSGGGADVIYAGQGNDFITIADLAFQRVDGGTGIDTLRLGNVNLNLSSLANNRLTNIEIIDLATTAGVQTLTVTPLEVLNISSSTNELTVDRGEEDNVILGTSWGLEGGESRGGKLYWVYRAGEARLLIQTNANQFGAGLWPNLLDPNLVDFVWKGAIGDNNVSFSFDGVTNILTQTVTKFNGVDTSSTLRFMGITGNIVLEGSGGKDTINASGLGDMSLIGRSVPTILGGGGGDSLVGSAGADYISTDGAEGADTIDGGAGNDTIFSGGGADSVRGGFGNDNIVDGGEGRDTIDAGDGNDTVQAGDGADSVIGGIGNDVLIGDQRDSDKTYKDTLLGGNGRDILMGGLGADSLDGGTGEDILIAGNHTSADLALSFISLEWNSSRTFAQRTANIAGMGTGPRVNGNDFLLVGTTVVNDNTVDSNGLPLNIIDIVLGGSTAGEADWIFADNPIDTRSDFQIGIDLLTDLSP